METGGSVRVFTGSEVVSTGHRESTTMPAEIADALTARAADAGADTDTDTRFHGFLRVLGNVESRGRPAEVRHQIALVGITIAKQDRRGVLFLTQSRPRFDKDVHTQIPAHPGTTDGRLRTQPRVSRMRSRYSLGVVPVMRRNILTAWAREA